MQNSKSKGRIDEISVRGVICAIDVIKKGPPHGAVLIIIEIFRCLRILHTKNVDKKRDFKACEHPRNRSLLSANEDFEVERNAEITFLGAFFTVRSPSSAPHSPLR